MPEFEFNRLRDEEKRGGFLDGDEDSFRLETLVPEPIEIVPNTDTPAMAVAPEHARDISLPVANSDVPLSLENTGLSQPKILLDEDAFIDHAPLVTSSSEALSDLSEDLGGEQWALHSSSDSTHNDEEQGTEITNTPKDTHENSDNALGVIAGTAAAVGIASAGVGAAKMVFGGDANNENDHHKQTYNQQNNQDKQDKNKERTSQQSTSTKPIPHKRSWFGRNAVALGVTSLVSVLGSGAAYMLLSQNGSPTIWIQRLMGKPALVVVADSIPLRIRTVDSGRALSDKVIGLDKEATANSSAKALVSALDSTAKALPTEKPTDSSAELTKNSAKNLTTTQVSTSTVSTQALSQNPHKQSVPPPNTGILNNEASQNTKQVAKPDEKSDTKQLLKQGSGEKGSGNVAGKAASKPIAALSKSVFTVQVYSTPSILDAERVRNRLKVERLPSVAILSGDVNGRFMHRVRFGSYPTQQDAERMVAKIGYRDAWIIRLR